VRWQKPLSTRIRQTQCRLKERHYSVLIHNAVVLAVDEFIRFKFQGEIYYGMVIKGAVTVKPVPLHCSSKLLYSEVLS